MINSQEKYSIIKDFPLGKRVVVNESGGHMAGQEGIIISYFFPYIVVQFDDTYAGQHSFLPKHLDLITDNKKCQNCLFENICKDKNNCPKEKH